MQFRTFVENQIFNSVTEVVSKRGGIKEAVINYPLSTIVSDPKAFFETVQAMYAREKKNAKPNQQITANIDFSNPKDLRRMDSHTKIHVTTGIIEWGGSTTENIPYWDRQALNSGFEYVYPDNHEELATIADIESVNGLRAVIGMLAPRMIESASAVQTLQTKLQRGTVTRASIGQHTQDKFHAWNVIHGDYHRVMVAKLKHLAYLTDKIPCREVRLFLLDEINQIQQEVLIEDNELQINMGIDGGLSEDTYRPPYYIVGVKQLEHLGVETISIPQSACSTWTKQDWANSIMREHGDSQLYEPVEYYLDWKYNNDD